MIDSFTVEMVASETFIDSLINKLPYCYWTNLIWLFNRTLIWTAWISILNITLWYRFY